MTLKYALTDDQLGQYYRKTNAIAARLGKSLPFEQTMCALQAIHDGMVVESKFSKWRTFRIGGVKKKYLLKQVKSDGVGVTRCAESVVNSPAFTTQNVTEEIDTIVLEVRDFDYVGRPTTAELLDPIRLAEWSKQNNHRLPEGYEAIELLPAEAGPHIRHQYNDQPNGEVLFMAMECILDFEDDLSVFRVERYSDNTFWLTTECIYIDGRWDLPDRFVFRLRKKVTQE